MANKIAVIKTGGKQYKVSEGQTIKIEKLDNEVGGKIKFPTLLIATDDAKDLQIGQPDLGEKVEGEIVEQGRDKKISVVKYKNKTRYKRTLGHKQCHTKVKINKIA